MDVLLLISGKIYTNTINLQRPSIFHPAEERPMPLLGLQLDTLTAFSFIPYPQCFICRYKAYKDVKNQIFLYTCLSFFQIIFMYFKV